MRCGAVLVVAAALAAALPAAAHADDARTAQLRLLCVQLSGDLTDPGGMAAFRRCMTSHNPLGAIRRNAAPPGRTLRLVSGQQVALTRSAGGEPGCGGGLVWREATPGDQLCVSHQVRAAMALDNAHAASRVGGPNGACRQGFVWREATPADHVCVTPATRALIRSQNTGGR
jgi:hypothetical protein